MDSNDPFGGAEISDGELLETLESMHQMAYNGGNSHTEDFLYNAMWDCFMSFDRTLNVLFPRVMYGRGKKIILIEPCIGTG